MNIKVIQKDEATGVLSIGMSRPPQYVSGIDLLVQIVVMEFLSSPGRDILNPGGGGNVRSLLGTNVNFEDEAEIFTEISMMVSATESNIKTIQEAYNRPANEKLARLEMVDIVPDDETMQLEIILRVVSMDQQSTEAIVGLK